jgi:hypothetical protein
VGGVPPPPFVRFRAYASQFGVTRLVITQFGQRAGIEKLQKRPSLAPVGWRVTNFGCDLLSE